MPYRMDPAPEVDDHGQRPCARGDRCATATVTVTGGHRIIEPALGYRTLCETDRGLALRCLEQLPGYYHQLGDRIGDHAASTGPKVSGSRTAPIPVNLTVDELRVELVNVIASWAGRVYQVAHLTGTVDADRPLTAYTERPVQAMCETLTAHLDALLALPAEPMTRFLTLTEADDLPEGTPVHRNYWAGYAKAVLDLDGAAAALEVFRLNARCRWILGHTGKDEKITGRCLACDLVDVLVRPDSSAGLEDFAECCACGTRYFGAEYTNLHLLRDAYEQELADQRRRAS
jgi:hypothetical protein